MRRDDGNLFGRAAKLFDCRCRVGNLCGLIGGALRDLIDRRCDDVDGRTRFVCSSRSLIGGCRKRRTRQRDVCNEVA